MLIAIDFDGTINNNLDIQPGERFSRPFPRSREYISELRSQGHKIMIFSCNRKAWIEEWMKNWAIQYDYIWEGNKPNYDLLIDDRAIHFDGNWARSYMNVHDKILKDKYGPIET